MNAMSTTYSSIGDINDSNNVYNSNRKWVILGIIATILIFIIAAFIIWNFSKRYCKTSHDKILDMSSWDNSRSDITHMRPPKNRSKNRGHKYRSVKLVSPMPTIHESSLERIISA